MTVVFATCAQQPFIADDDQPLAEALSALGYRVEPEPWTDIDPSAQLVSDPVVLRSTWDYHRVPTMFTAWLNAMADSGRVLLNPADVARANIDKVYLEGLKAAGIAIPRSRWVEKPDADTLATMLREEGWAKPLERQCLVINSTSTSGSYDEHWTTIKGTVQNVCGDTFSFVSVKFQLTDASGAVVGNAIDSLTGLGPLQSWRFKALGPTAPKFGSGEVQGYKQR